MNTNVANLLRLVGIGFEFKLELGRFFSSALANPLVSAYNSAPNTPAARTALLVKYNTAGPSMSFSTEQYTYELLALLAQIVDANDDFSAPEKAALNKLVLSTQRYVGIDEGDHESFHFMVEAYKLAASLASLIGAATGQIVTLSLTAGGDGFTIDGIDEDVVGLVVNVETQDGTPPVGYTMGRATVTVVAGEVTAITAITQGGNGFVVGETVTLEPRTAEAGQSGATFVLAATATVTQILDI
jgi:hypothetical protein